MGGGGVRGLVVQLLFFGPPLRAPLWLCFTPPGFVLVDLTRLRVWFVSCAGGLGVGFGVLSVWF